MANNPNDPRWQRAEDALKQGDGAGALYIFKSLAQSGDESAYINIAHLYELGENGIEKDYEEALKYYRKSFFEFQDVHPAVDLARIHLWGCGIEQNFEMARKFLEQAEANQIAVVYLMLGQIYWYGLGVKRNLQRGKRYFLKALAKGNVRAYPYIGNALFTEGRWIIGVWLRIIVVFITIYLYIKDPEDPRIRFA